MKLLKVIIVILLLFFVTVLAVVSCFRLHNDSLSSSSSRLALPEFRPEDVRSLEISWRTQRSTLVFVPDDQYWAVKERDGAQVHPHRSRTFWRASRKPRR